MRIRAAIFAISSVLVCPLAASPGHAAEAKPAQSGMADINGIRIYYEIHGEGEPLLLLHGGLGHAGHWSGQIPALAEKYRVVAMDGRGHGRSSFGDKPIGYELMMGDVVGLMDHLGIERADVLGWSDGGNIVLYLAANHPERLNKVIAYGANYSPAGVRSDVGTNAAITAYVGKAAADYQTLAPAPERWEEFMGNIGNMWATEPNFTAEQLGAITTPILVLVGQAEEAIYDEHTREMAALIPSAELRTMEGTGHFAHWEKEEEFNQIVLDYLGRDEDAVQSLLEADRAWSETVADADAFTAYLSPGVYFMAPDVPRTQGPGAFRSSIDRLLGLPGAQLTWAPDVAEVSESGDLGHTIGSFELTLDGPDGEPISRRGKYATLWKRQVDGGWEVLTDTFNFDAPMPSAAGDGTDQAD